MRMVAGETEGIFVKVGRWRVVVRERLVGEESEVVNEVLVVREETGGRGDSDD